MCRCQGALIHLTHSRCRSAFTNTHTHTHRYTYTICTIGANYITLSVEKRRSSSDSSTTCNDNVATRRHATNVCCHKARQLVDVECCMPRCGMCEFSKLISVGRLKNVKLVELIFLKYLHFSNAQRHIHTY